MIYLIIAAIIGILSAIIDYKYKTKIGRYIIIFVLGMITMLTIEIIEILMK